MIRITMEPQEIDEISRLLDSIVDRYETVEDPGFLREADLLAHELPKRLRRQVLEFKRCEPGDGCLVLGGYPMDFERIGPTPEHWSQRQTPASTLREEILFVLFGSLLGEPIAWATQQDGYLVHDILPVKGLEHEQLGLGSEELLWWHTEDAFHEYRGDYIGMMCVRNLDAVPTTVCAIQDLDISPRQRELLFEPIYPIKPDESHLVKNKSNDHDLDEDLQKAYEKMHHQFDEPDRIAVLFGAEDSPYMRLDPYFMDRQDDAPEAQAAFDDLTAQIDRNLQDLVLRSGDLCFIDNFLAVHGRKPFKARYDGQDRWLKRINIVRDLRKSRSARETPESRVIRS